jgi:DGQHR domain-containing protein
MKFFFPDSQDFIDPGFDFEREEYTPGRVRQRDDQYAHEFFPESPYDGLLLSRASVQGKGGGDEESKYTDAQRHRLLRVGAREFFRLGDRPLQILGDCGAFSYVREKVPPVTPDEVLHFYEASGVDVGASVDHIILGYQSEADRTLPGIDLVPEDWRMRQDITLQLAAAFRRRHTARGCRFEPLGVAQGWSPDSYARAVECLQAMGYRRIGLGGLVPLKTPEVLACLAAVAAVRRAETQFHLFGVTRCEHVPQFQAYGVTSFDSTSLLKQAFMDDRDNYYTPSRTYIAVRVPQVEKHLKLCRRIRSGEVDQGEANRLERTCLAVLDAYGRRQAGLEEALAVLRAYEQLHDGQKDRTALYREVLQDRPWEACPCAVCHRLREQDMGIQVVIFRRAERKPAARLPQPLADVQPAAAHLGPESEGIMTGANGTSGVQGSQQPSPFAPEPLRLYALESRQGQDHVLYAFWADGKDLPSFTTVSRLRRQQDAALSGYQRWEVQSHIAEIRAYLESANPMLPNALVVAFDPVLHFEPLPLPALGYGRFGILVIPLPDGPDGRKPAWVVDGQQRLAALREAALQGFPVCVVGFLAASEAEQREQFILVNNTKPLPKGLVYELLPATSGQLPAMLQRRRFPTMLLNRLNLDEDSQLCGLVRTPTMPDGLIKDNSLMKMLENSLSDGVLYRFRGPEGDDVEGMLHVVKRFWAAVEEVFRPARGQPPRRSRLLHGAGVIALGFLMDAIADRHRGTDGPNVEQFRADLEALREVCRWTDGYWEFGPGAQRKWNEVQNTPKDIQILANYLLVQYKALVWNRNIESA